MSKDELLIFRGGTTSGLLRNLNQPFRIHMITNGNADLLDRVAEDVFDHPIEPQRLAAFLADPNSILVVATEGDIVVGQGRGTIIPQPDRQSDFYIDNLGVATPHHRRGIGRAMFLALSDAAKSLGAVDIWLAAEGEDNVATAFYNALGLKGRTVNYFSSDK